eukprot:m.47631 g.47631  ORF g.47631 m.47631 type:complete len:1103 (-) comp13238_c0_seq2:113-3421(-)
MMAVSLVLLLAAAVQGQQSDLDTIHARLFDFYLEFGDCTQTSFCLQGGYFLPLDGTGCNVTCAIAANVSHSLTTYGNWSDVNYIAQTSSFWEATSHLERTLAMARATYCPSCSANYSTQVNLALNYWFQRKPHPPQWWWQEIGEPQYVAAILVMMNRTYTSTQLQNGLAIMAAAANYPNKEGQNRVWEQQVVINAAVLSNNVTLATTVFQSMWAGVRVTTGDGPQPDGSFHFHGPQLYTGGYGGDYALQLMTIAGISSNTAFQMTPNASTVLFDTLLQGQQYAIRAVPRSHAPITPSYYDISVKGREITRVPDGSLTFPASVYAASLGAEVFQDTSVGLAFKEFWHRLQPTSDGVGPLESTRHFYSSDYTVHHREGFFISLKMLSNRMYNAETVNKEGLQSWHLSDGALYTYLSGAEYAGIFPVWDWTRIPGTLSRLGVKGTVARMQQLGSTGHVGGCAEINVRGNPLGVSTMQFESGNYGGAQEKSRLRALRTWFMVDEGVIALINDIALASQKQAVVTNLEQSLLQGDVLVDGKPFPSNQSVTAPVQWIHHNNILYLPALTNSSIPVTVSTVVQRGSWSAINAGESSDPVALPVFSAYLQHGMSPRVTKPSAAYAILPGVSAKDAEKQAENMLNGHLVTILRNDAEAQAVRYAPSLAYVSIMASTWVDKAVVTDGSTTIQVSSPATVIVSNRSGLVSFAVADPSGNASTITVVINRSLASLLTRHSSSNTPLKCTALDAGSTSVTIDLTAINAGATMAGTCVDTNASNYKVSVTYHAATPVLSHSNAVGNGYSPCKFTFNPSYIPASVTFPHGGIYVRLNECPNSTAMATGGEHLGFAMCDLNGTCQDLSSSLLEFPEVTEDPRALYYQDWYYLFYYNQSLVNSGLNTVTLAKTQTPLDISSYSFIGTYPWHRNACCMMKPKGQRTYCIWGEGPDPLPGLGISYTTDIDSGVFVQVPWRDSYGSTLTTDGMYMLPWGYTHDEVKLEAGTHPVELSTGDWLHFYAAATPGWVPNGNYTAGFIVLDKNDPSRIIQRSESFVLTPTYEYETLCNGNKDCPYSGERKNVIFLCSATPTGNKDEFRLFYGAGDGNVGTALVQVTV